MPLTVAEARAKIHRYYISHLKEFLRGEFDGYRVGLQPPTAVKAAQKYEETQAFIRQWEHQENVEFVARNWSSAGLGRVEVPIRLVFDSMEALIKFAEADRDWDELLNRFDALAAFSVDARTSTIKLWNELPMEDIEKIAPVVQWFVENPDSGLLKRAVAVEGVHTKWLERHKELVETFLADKRGEQGRAELGLSTPETRVRLRFHESEGPGGLSDIETTLSNLSALEAALAVLMVENLESFLALPTWPGVILAWGAGYRALDIVTAEFFQKQALFYWSDLDIDGFKILDQVRARVPGTRSVLMDPETVTRWAYLGVADRSFVAESFESLTAQESEALEQLIMAGHLRIEQERIRLDIAVTEIEAALGK